MTGILQWASQGRTRSVFSLVPEHPHLWCIPCLCANDAFLCSSLIVVSQHFSVRRRVRPPVYCRSVKAKSFEKCFLCRRFPNSHAPLRCYPRLGLHFVPMPPPPSLFFGVRPCSKSESETQSHSANTNQAKSVRPTANGQTHNPQPCFNIYVCMCGGGCLSITNYITFSYVDFFFWLGSACVPVMDSAQHALPGTGRWEWEQGHVFSLLKYNETLLHQSQQ